MELTTFHYFVINIAHTFAPYCFRYVCNISNTSYTDLFNLSSFSVVTTTAGPLEIIEPALPYIPPAIPPTVAALAPPTLPMFPPQGVVQPGAIAQGGGALPASVAVKTSF